MNSALWILDSSVAPSCDNWIAYKGADGIVHLRVIQ